MNKKNLFRPLTGNSLFSRAEMREKRVQELAKKNTHYKYEYYKKHPDPSSLILGDWGKQLAKALKI